MRPATNTDGNAVRTLVFEVLREYGLSPDPEGTDADLPKIEEHYRDGWFSVLEVDGQIIGSVGLLPHAGTVMELRKMYLHRDWRGRGLGRLLLNQALDEARKRGARRVVLGTARVLGEAVAWNELAALVLILAGVVATGRRARLAPGRRPPGLRP